MRGGATAHYKGNEDGGGSGGVMARGDGMSRYGWCDNVFFYGCVAFLLRAISTKFMQRRSYARASVSIVQNILEC